MQRTRIFLEKPQSSPQSYTIHLFINRSFEIRKKSGMEAYHLANSLFVDEDYESAVQVFGPLEISCYDDDWILYVAELHLLSGTRANSCSSTFEQRNHIPQAQEV